MKLIYGNYYCTEDGRVFNYKLNREVQGYSKDGYLRIDIIRNNTKKRIRKHRFIWEYFNGEIPKGFQINHIDGNKTNNSLNNLELNTAKQNAQHAGKLGLLSNWNRGSQRVFCVELNKEFRSVREAERECGLTRGTIRFTSVNPRRINTKTSKYTFRKV